MMDVCSPLFLFLFTYFDVVLLLKFTGMQPLAEDLEDRLPELSLYVLIFPYLLLSAYIGILESLAWRNALLAGATLIAVAFITLVLDVRIKNKPEFFKKLSFQLNTWLIALNAVILGVVSTSVCGGGESIALVALPLGGYVLLSWKYSNVVNKMKAMKT
ncbi:hypothetical protein [Thermococcus sp. Bubb.Bath]|uniref:hypothetical protein n=1 Tax=Thermococcus sp. Bubb.Bath TaxID=1638242 RepID=UPI00143BBC94|nr:hypothetical protein [Thermococcus sp. Bubb.Bath]NJF25584.1 hypothetical protein [Thermococcus sp. Bubb.Bath]